MQFCLSLKKLEDVIMANSIVSFSFDDGRLDSKRAIEIALDYGIYSTINITTGYVDRSLESNKWPCKAFPMTKEDVVYLKTKGVEIACHGNEHNNDIDNIINGKRILQQWLGERNESLIGFASPHSQLVLSEENLILLKKHFNYLRIGPFIGKPPITHKVLRKIARSTGNKYAFANAFYDIARNPIEGYIIRSVPVMKENTAEQIQYYIQKCAEYKSIIVLMFHSILSSEEAGYDDAFSWDLEKYIKLCKYIGANKSVDTMTTMDAIEAYSRML